MLESWQVLVASGKTHQPFQVTDHQTQSQVQYEQHWHPLPCHQPSLPGYLLQLCQNHLDLCLVQWTTCVAKQSDVFSTWNQRLVLWSLHTIAPPPPPHPHPPSPCLKCYSQSSKWACSVWTICHVMKRKWRVSKVAKMVPVTNPSKLWGVTWHFHSVSNVLFVSTMNTMSNSECPLPFLPGGWSWLALTFVIIQSYSQYVLYRWLFWALH